MELHYSSLLLHVVELNCDCCWHYRAWLAEKEMHVTIALVVYCQVKIELFNQPLIKKATNSVCKLSSLETTVSSNLFTVTMVQSLITFHVLDKLYFQPGYILRM